MEKATISRNVFVMTIGGIAGLHCVGIAGFDSQMKKVMKNLEGVVLVIAEAAASGAPPSLALPRKGGGNGTAAVASSEELSQKAVRRC